MPKADYERTGWQHKSAPVQTEKFETVFSKKQKEIDIGTGKEYKRLPLPALPLPESNDGRQPKPSNVLVGEAD